MYSDKSIIKIIIIIIIIIIIKDQVLTACGSSTIRSMLFAWKATFG